MHMKSADERYIYADDGFDQFPSYDLDTATIHQSCRTIVPRHLFSQARFDTLRLTVRLTINRDRR